TRAPGNFIRSGGKKILLSLMISLRASARNPSLRDCPKKYLKPPPMRITATGGISVVSAVYITSGNFGSESRHLIVKRLRAPALLIRQFRYSSEAGLDHPHPIIVRRLFSLRFLHELLIKLLIRFIQSPYRFKRQTRQFFLLRLRKFAHPLS